MYSGRPRTFKRFARRHRRATYSTNFLKWLKKKDGRTFYRHVLGLKSLLKTQYRLNLTQFYHEGGELFFNIPQSFHKRIFDVKLNSCFQQRQITATCNFKKPLQNKKMGMIWICLAII